MTVSDRHVMCSGIGRQSRADYAASVKIKLVAYVEMGNIERRKRADTIICTKLTGACNNNRGVG